jgi:hypothetical protein
MVLSAPPLTCRNTAECPGKLEKWIFCNHPSGYNRIHSAMVWKGEFVRPDASKFLLRLPLEKGMAIGLGFALRGNWVGRGSVLAQQRSQRFSALAVRHLFLKKTSDLTYPPNREYISTTKVIPIDLYVVCASIGTNC